MEQSTFTTIRTFDNAMDAHILKSAIEAEGFQCFLIDENIVSMNPLYNITVGGIKLKVASTVAEEVQAFLAELEQRPYTNELNETIHCPKCNSTSIKMGQRSFKDPATIFAGIVALVLAVFPLYGKKINRCNECNWEWK